jgi:hypothetical protein
VVLRVVFSRALFGVQWKLAESLSGYPLTAYDLQVTLYATRRPLLAGFLVCLAVLVAFLLAPWRTRVPTA